MKLHDRMPGEVGKATTRRRTANFFLVLLDMCSVRSRRWRGAGTRAGRVGASARPVNTGTGTASELPACLLLSFYVRFFVLGSFFLTEALA